VAVRAREMQRVGIRGMASGSVLRGRGSEEKEWLLGQPFEAEAEGRKTGGRQSVDQFAHASAKSLSILSSIVAGSARPHCSDRPQCSV
jgi:hypothetical protein